MDEDSQMSDKKITNRTRLTSLAVLVIVSTLSVPALAAGGLEGGFPWGHWAVSLFNLLVFLGIVFYFAWKPMNDYFADRRDGMLSDLKESKRLREEAEMKFEEYSARLDKLDQEREELMNQYHKEGEQEKERMVAEAQRQVEQMRKDAELVIEQEVRKAVAAIEAQAVDIALDLAETRLHERIDSNVQNVLVDDYVDRLKTSDAA